MPARWARSLWDSPPVLAPDPDRAFAGQDTVHQSGGQKLLLAAGQGGVEGADGGHVVGVLAGLDQGAIVGLGQDHHALAVGGDDGLDGHRLGSLIRAVDAYHQLDGIPYAAQP